MGYGTVVLICVADLLSLELEPAYEFRINGRAEFGPRYGPVLR